jgi:hypothetical protein
LLTHITEALKFVCLMSLRDTPMTVDQSASRAASFRLQRFDVSPVGVIGDKLVAVNRNGAAARLAEHAKLNIGQKGAKRRHIAA